MREDFLTRVNILGGLIDIVVEYPFTNESRKMLTKRRTPIPAEIKFAGENICEVDVRKQVLVERLTSGDSLVQPLPPASQRTRRGH